MEEMTPTQSTEKESAEHPLMGIMKSFSEPNTGDEALIIQQFPEEITKQMSLLANLQKKKDNAWEKAQKAQEAAEQMKSFVSKKFLGHEYKSGDKADIITDTQNVVKLVADSEKDLAEAMKISFDFQEALSKSTELLFGMGCINIAANEAMIDQIVSIRDNKGTLGKFQLTEDVKNRILDVANRLKAHQDLLRRQTIHEERIKRQFASWQKDYDEALSKIQDGISDLDTIRSNAALGATAIQKHQDISGKQDIIADLDSIRNGAALGATAIQEHQDISGKADISFVEKQLQCTKDNLSQEVTTLQQTLQKAQEDLQKEHQEHIKLKRALVTTSIGIGTISVGALIALLILIL